MISKMELLDRLALSFRCQKQCNDDNTTYKLHKNNEIYLKDLMIFMKNNKIKYEIDRDIFYYESDEGMEESYFFEIIISNQ